MIIENTLPGVTAVVNEGQVARPLKRQPSSTAFVIGFAPWGPIGVRTVVSGWGDYVRKFGGFHSAGWLGQFAWIFFNLFSGKTIIAVRAGGDAAAKATITVNNRVGSPDATFQFDAKYPSSTVDISVKIADVDGNTNVVDVEISSVALNITETYRSADLRLDATLNAINEKSRLVDISLAADVVAGATGRPAAGTFALADGDDDAASVADADLGAYLSQFGDENLGGGQVVIPGYGVANQADLIAHAALYNRLALLDDELATEYTDAVDHFDDHPSSFAAAYFPWVKLQNFETGSGTKFYPPTCFAAGACAQVDSTIGTHKAPANLTVPGAVDVERNEDGTSMIDDNVRQYLNARNVNAIAPIAGQGIKIYGERVLAETGETRVSFVHERRVLNLIYYTAKLGYSWAVFQVVDGAGRLFRDLRSTGVGFLRVLRQNGALYGRTDDEAFIVIADETNNPPEDLEQGIVHVQLGAKISPTAEVVMINIDNVPLSQNLNVLNGGDN
jgi:phage tail sheath protein FI